MPVTKLDEVAALVIIDLQKGIVSRATVHPVVEIVERSARLARAFREKGLPVVLVHVSGMAPGRTDAARPGGSFPADWAELVPELGRQASDHIVTKQCFGAFHGSDLHEYLQSRGATQIFLTGIATSIGVESTARSAYDLGYNVAVVVDAVTDRDEDSHHHTVEKIFPRIAETGTTEDVLRLLKA